MLFGAGVSKQISMGVRRPVCIELSCGHTAAWCNTGTSRDPYFLTDLKEMVQPGHLAISCPLRIDVMLGCSVVRALDSAGFRTLLLRQAGEQVPYTLFSL